MKICSASLFVLFISLLINPITAFADVESSIINLPSLAGKSPGLDLYWGTTDDEDGVNNADLATQFGADVPGLNTIGGAGFAIDDEGNRNYSGEGTVAVNRDLTNALFGEPYQFTTISIGVEYQGARDGVEGPQTNSANPSGTITLNENHTYSYTNEILDTFGNTISTTATGNWINSGDDPDTIFGAGTNIANHFNFLIAELASAGTTWASLTAETGTYEIIAGGDSGATGKFFR